MSINDIIHAARMVRSSERRQAAGHHRLRETESLTEEFQRIGIVVNNWQQRSGRLSRIQHMVDRADDMAGKCS